MTGDTTKLESFLRANRLSNYCSCESNTTHLYIRHQVYLGCPKCGRAMSMALTHEEAQLVQERGW